MTSKKYNWLEYVDFTTTLTSINGINLIPLVTEFRDEVLIYLEEIEKPTPFINPPRNKNRPDLKNINNGEVYYLHYKKIYKGKDLNALELFYMCLDIIKRGELLPVHKARLPILVQGMAGLVSHQNSKNASKPRKHKIPILKTEFIGELRNNPNDTFKEIMIRLDGRKEALISWDDTVIKWRDDEDNEIETPTSTVRGWRTEFNKNRK